MAGGTVDRALFSFVITYGVDSRRGTHAASFGNRSEAQSVNSEPALNSTTYA